MARDVTVQYYITYSSTMDGCTLHCMSALFARWTGAFAFVAATAETGHWTERHSEKRVKISIG